MSHYKGHVDEPQASCGIIRLYENLNGGDDPGLYYIPSKWNLVKNQAVGFHVIKIPHGLAYMHVAYDVIPWEEHEDAQKAYMIQNNLDKEKKLEDVIRDNKSAFKASIDAFNDATDTKDDERILITSRAKEILRQSLAYMGTAEGGELTNPGYTDKDGYATGALRLMIGTPLKALRNGK